MLANSEAALGQTQEPGAQSGSLGGGRDPTSVLVTKDLLHVFLFMVIVNFSLEILFVFFYWGCISLMNLI